MTWESFLTPQEKRLYSHLFQLVSKSQDGIVLGTEAVQFFATSGVPNEILSEIWETADRDKVGYLLPETFAIALKLIACAQHGKEATEPILATSVPLPQFDGVVAPSPMITKSDSIPITAAEREKYSNIFRVHQPTNGAMDAETARNVFLKSKLPTDTLGQIWALADVRQSGTLSQTEFVIAMHYIAKLMDGTLKSLPDKLPSAVFQSASGTAASPMIAHPSASSLGRQPTVMTPPQRSQTIDSLGNMAFGQSEWDVTAQERKQFNTYFDKIDSGRHGHIQGKEAVEFFKNSRLPESELAHIWDLSDIHQRGSLSRDEFAVAMHLIHQRLQGETLPQSLPKSLIPPNSKQNVFASPAMAFASPSFASPAPVFSSPAPVFASPMANTDLLGDFGDDQVSTEINQVNLLQNQITSTTSHTNQIQDQKRANENTLEHLTSQRQQLETEMTQIKMKHDQAVKELNELQEQVRHEEQAWDTVRGEYNAAQEALIAIQHEAAQITQTLDNGRAETESLKRRITDIHLETRQATDTLNQLRGQSKQQDMMLDINRRQVTAAEQDRTEAERQLEEYKTTNGIQEEPSSVMNTPALDKLFVSPKVESVTSPFDEFNHKLDQPQTSANDFDAIFGTSMDTHVDTPTFDSAQWPTSPTKSIRGPPPPPPQSRHHRQASISSVSSGARKQRAPPPPPPAASAVPAATSSVMPVDHKKIDDDEDFEAAFSGSQFPEAKIGSKEDDFADFDDAFSSFDIKEAKHSAEAKDDWATAFESFQAPKTATKSKEEDDWDSVFGGGSNVVKPSSSGFDDSFSSFADDFGKSKPASAEPSKKVTASITDDKIENLVKMGFAEQEAKDALNRYDQDLEKASNFLLDQAK
ncbi:hypothetical protein BY458DRAFT_447881 [Sporodiniella umbellata]|nr:hypothetical protein BY458DRAFT_447881 [Sporodiniella umbellata]